MGSAHPAAGAGGGTKGEDRKTWAVAGTQSPAAARPRRAS